MFSDEMVRRTLRHPMSILERTDSSSRRYTILIPKRKVLDCHHENESIFEILIIESRSFDV